MPKGEPKKQTIASEKYQKKAGYTVKSFKLKKNVVERFENACREAGITSQAALVTKWMENFIEETEKMSGK